MTIEVGEERVQDELRKAARKLARQLNIPGFRKGRAPYNVVVQHVGVGALYEEFVDKLGQEVYEKAIEQEEIKPYATASLEDIQLEPLRYTLTVPLEPTVKVGDYRSLRVEEPEVEVDEEEVEARLEQLRDRHAGYVQVERPVEFGDLVTIDVKAVLLDDEGNETDTVVLEETDWDVTPDKETPMEPPGLDEALVGMKPGEEKEVVLAWPEDSQSMYAGKSARFQLKVHNIQAYQKPELDDDFAKTVSEEFETLEALKEHIREDLKAEATSEAENKYLETVLDKLVEISELEYPPAAVEMQIDQIAQDMDTQLRQMGLQGLGQLLEMQNQTYEQYRESIREQAEIRLRRNLVLSEIRKLEDISATDEEIEARLQEIAGEQAEDEQAETSRKAFIEMMRGQGRQILEDQIISEKTLDLVLAIARGEEVPAPGEHKPAVVASDEEAEGEATEEANGEKEADAEAEAETAEPAAESNEDEAGDETDAA
jgi:trigger factor